MWHNEFLEMNEPKHTKDLAIGYLKVCSDLQIISGLSIIMLQPKDMSNLES